MRRAGAGCAVVLLLAASRAHAEVDPDTHARSNALFDAGKQLLAQGKPSAACVSFERSYQLEPRGGTLLNLGLCHEQIGQLRAARRELLEALALAKRDGRSDREPLALQHISAVEARLGFLELSAGEQATDGLELRVDGELVPESERAAWPVAPGRHVVSASAPGRASAQSVWQVAAGEKLRVPPLVLAEAPAPRAPAVETPAAISSKPERTEPAAPPAAVSSKHAPTETQPFGALRTVSLIVGLVGVAGSIVSGAFALGQKGVVRDHCDARKRCDHTGVEAASAGAALSLASDIAFATGVVGVGVWLVVPGGPLDPSERALGMRVTGAF